MEFLWVPQPDYFGREKAIWTHATNMLYNSPEGFDLDERWNNVSPIIDLKDSDLNNVDEKVQKFYEWVQTLKQIYQIPHLFVPMGGDFEYGNANYNFMNNDKLIKYFNL